MYVNVHLIYDQSSKKSCKNLIVNAIIFKPNKQRDSTS